MFEIAMRKYLMSFFNIWLREISSHGPEPRSWELGMSSNLQSCFVPDYRSSSGCISRSCPFGQRATISPTLTLAFRSHPSLAFKSMRSFLAGSAHWLWQVISSWKEQKYTFHLRDMDSGLSLFDLSTHPVVYTQRLLWRQMRRRKG